MTSPQVDIVIVTYRSEKFLPRLLDDIDSLSRLDRSVHLFDNDGNPKTLSRAWNDLATLGRAPFLVVLNPDCALSPGWDFALKEVLDRRPDVGIVTPPRFREGPMPTRDEMATAAQAAPDGEVQSYPGVYHNKGFFCAMMRRSQFEALHGFDERLRFYGQDADIGRRLYSRWGLHFVHANKCQVWHQEGGSRAEGEAHGEFSNQLEWDHYSWVWKQLLNKDLKDWDLLTHDERDLVRQDPVFSKMMVGRNPAGKTVSSPANPLALKETSSMSQGPELFENIPTRKAGDNGSSGTSIVLVSMIKNESKVIRRMLDSVASVASHYCLLDTGSTDTTVKEIQEWAKLRDLPLALYSSPFIDFGTTRTEAVQKAVGWTRKLKLDLDKTYFLLLDADMMLESHGFERSQLKEDNYRLSQDGGGLAYYNTRLVRSSKAKGYKGRTHEYLETVGTIGDLHSLIIRDLGDGGCKADKFERDVRLLTKDLEENPNNARSMYYLGASYEAVGKFAEAIDMYTKRANAPNAWEEEAWMALYRRGITKNAAGDKDGAAKDFAEAWLRRPWRAEPLAKLANLALEQKQYRNACAVAKAGISIPYPHGDSLFIETRCYNEEFHRLLAIADYYTGNKYDGLNHCDQLILNPSSNHYNALQNAVWYTTPIKVSKRIDLGEMFKEHIPEGFHPCNPSLIRHFDRRKGAYRYIMSLRMVNFWINDDGSYGFKGPGQTRTLRCELSHNLEKGSVSELENPAPEPNSRIFGIEDVRLYQDRLHDDSTYALGIRLDGIEKQPQIYNCVWADNKLVSCIRISDPGRTEKNWLPIMNRIAEDYRMPAGPHVLYSTGPDIVKMRAGLGIYYQGRPSVDTQDFRGGSNVIPYLGGWLWVIHQVAVLPQQTKRKYLHRLCWSRGDQDGPTVDGFRTSSPFCFEKTQIEFCSGACPGPDGSLLLTYGIEDARAHLVVIDEKTVTSMLKL